MDGIPNSIAQGVSGALAAQPAAAQQSSRLRREQRQIERTGTADAPADAVDAPVERVEEASSLTSQLPSRPIEAPDERPHLDVRA